MRPGSLVLAAVLTLHAQTSVETVRVVSDSPDRKISLTGEILPYLAVDLNARVNGYVERVAVDRGSSVARGQLLLALSAPEMQAQLAEAESKVQIIESQRIEAEAKLASAASTYDRVKAASATPGAVAGHELVVAREAVSAAKALTASFEGSKRAAQSAVEASREMQKYLRITAPFDGVITERLVHPGALVGPGGDGGALLRLEQVSRLRLVVAVPETEVGAIRRGTKLSFGVPAHPGERFTGVIARIPQAMDFKTRTMPVELDVMNVGGRLSPGMYADVTWLVRRAKPSLLVPPASIVTTTESVFVIRVSAGRAEWVPVRRGRSAGDLMEVAGDLRAGDEIVARATDEIRDGTLLQVRRSAAPK